MHLKRRFDKSLVIGTLASIALLVPAMIVAITGRNLPALARRVDDGIYFVTAHSIATEFSYKISSLPGVPYQTKYPPAYPALLAAAWKVPPYPNLPVALLLNWLALPVYAFATIRLARIAGLSPAWTGVVALGAVCGHETLWDSVTLMSDLWFSALILAALVLIGRWRECEGYSGIYAAVIVTDLAYLTRTSGIVLPFAICLVLVAGRRWRPALLFALGTLPVIAAWSWWATAHTPASLPDYNDIFNLSYAGQLRAETNWRLLPARVYQKAIQGILSPATVLQPLFGHGAVTIGICTCVLTLCVAGYRRLIRMEVFQVAAAFVALYIALVLIWPWVLYPRLILPVFPLLLIGLAVTLDRAHVPFVLPAFLFGAIYILSSVQQIVFLSHAGDGAPVEAYAWVQTHTPADASFVADPDSLFWMHTGRAAETIHASVREDQTPESGRERLIDIPGFARKRKHEYVFFTGNFLDRSWSTVTRDQMRQRLESDPGVEAVYRRQALTIYRIRPQ